MTIDEGLWLDIAGRRQWVAVRGKGRANPALMFIGGAGGGFAAIAPFFSPWEDDFTMVTLERSGGQTRMSGSSNGTVLADFDLPSAPGNERQAMELVERAVADIGLHATRLERLKTAVAEATMNAMEHGNEYRADRPVSIGVLRSPDRLRVQVTDRGDAGELAEAEEPDLEAKLEGRQKPRGWGLFLIEKMVDEARVMSEGGGRTVELVLRLEGGRDDGE